MQPKPMAETSGPFFPSGRCRIFFSPSKNQEIPSWMKVSRFQILSRLQNRILRYNKMVFRAKYGVTAQEFANGSIGAGERAQEINMLRYIFAIALILAASAGSGAIFLLALIHQFALVEIAASLVTAMQVYFLSSAIADMIERAKQPSRQRNSLAILFAIFLVALYSFTRYFR